MNIDNNMNSSYDGDLLLTRRENSLYSVDGDVLWVASRAWVHSNLTELLYG
jgi:hypothetical protein